jgi:cell wall-associated NlpC family hydrolase
MAALGLICVLASGSCWAQQSTPSTSDKPKTHAKAAKPAAKKADAKASAKPAKSGKKTASKDSAKDATKDAAKDTAKDAGKDAKAKPAEAEKSEKAPATDKTATAKPEAKTAETKADARNDSRAEAAPPAGTMMGAYGQSLMRSPAGTAAAATTVAAAGTAAALAATAPATPTASTTPATALPPTALMGAAVGNANANASDSVARFLQQRGIVAQAQGQALPPSAETASPGLLNQVRDKASDLVLSAMNFLGVPYKRGGNSVNNGFDCSGFTRHIFEMSVGLVLPRRADEQAKMSSLVPIKKEDLKPGDLVFFNTMRATFSHVGIYVGEGKFIHSPRVGGAVRVEDMREAYWAKRFTGARRADLNQANAGG